MGKLTDRTVKASGIGRHGDGGGLYLEVRAANYWVQPRNYPATLRWPRWWLICPQTGRRATKLHLPDGTRKFASRQAHRLAYACQRERAHERASRRFFRLRDKLGATGGIGENVEKPEWMRRRTFERITAQIDKAEEVV
jgi:hypothetical protein